MHTENESLKEEHSLDHQSPEEKFSDIHHSGQSYARFFTESFLLNHGWMVFQSLLKKSSYYLLTIAAQVFVFGGGLGLIWVLLI